MTILLGLLAALAYGSSDFAAGVGGRRIGPGRIALWVHVFALPVALAGLALFPGQALTWQITAWGLLAGLCSAVGLFSLYRGLIIGQMSVVAPMSGVVSAVLPAVVGLLGGDRLSATSTTGLILALPAIAMVSMQTGERSSEHVSQPSGLLEGALGGAGIGGLLICLHHAGGDAGTWPLVIAMSLAALILWPVAARGRDKLASPPRRLWATVACAGLLAGAANLLFLGASLSGQLTIASVLTALYPAVTIVLARVLLGEHWNRTQVAGLIAAGFAVILISYG